MLSAAMTKFPGRTAVSLLLLAGMLVLTGCGGQTQQAPPGEGAATPVARSATEPAATPAVSAPPPVQQPPSRSRQAIWLVDIENGAGPFVLSGDLGDVYKAEFAPKSGLVILHGDGRALHFSLDGRLIETVEAVQDCVPTADGVIISGRVYAGVRCGLFSPDGRWLTYAVPVHDGVSTVQRPADWDQWAVNLESGEKRLLQAGLKHCGGCDGRFGPAWSASGRFVYFAEYAGERRTFLSDLASGATTVVSRGRNEVPDQPAWSSASDLLLRPSERGTAVLDDPAHMVSRELPDLPWPARFDATGSLIYGWIQSPGAAATVILDARTRQMLDRLEGSPPREHAFGLAMRVQVAAGAGGYVAALESAPACKGTMIYAGALPPFCVDTGFGAVLSPDGGRVALAWPTAGGPDASGLQPYQIVVIETSTHEALIIDGEAASFGPPLMQWSASGSHLLVRWASRVLGP
jgi:hypothetical protein